MAERKPLAEYGPFILGPHEEGLDIGKLERLHTITLDFRDNLLSDEDLRYVLLDKLLRFRDDEPNIRSYTDIPSNVFIRRKNALMLQVADYLIERISRPPSVILGAGSLLILPGQYGKRDLTPEGHDVERLEEMHRKWMGSPDITSQVLAYRNALERSLDEFNLQMILGLMGHERDRPIDDRWKRMCAYQRRINEVWFPQGQYHLDSAYYNAGKRAFAQVGPYWETLQNSEFGKMFTLSNDEVLNGLSSTAQ